MLTYCAENIRRFCSGSLKQDALVKNSYTSNRNWIIKIWLKTASSKNLTVSIDTNNIFGIEDLNYEDEEPRENVTSRRARV